MKIKNYQNSYITQNKKKIVYQNKLMNFKIKLIQAICLNLKHTPYKIINYKIVKI